jgi:hypothetical protein
LRDRRVHAWWNSSRAADRSPRLARDIAWCQASSQVQYETKVEQSWELLRIEEAAVAGLGLTGLHVHDLRHTGNTLAARSGVSHGT